ncbi:MAG: hypothetical protein AAGA30_18415 [Planctomycetota bacterium]
MAALNNAAISIHRVLSDPEIPLRAAADYVQWRPKIGIKLLASDWLCSSPGISLRSLEFDTC